MVGVLGSFCFEANPSSQRYREEARNYSSANTNGTLFYEEECLERLAEDLKKAVDELEK